LIGIFFFRFCIGVLRLELWVNVLLVCEPLERYVSIIIITLRFLLTHALARLWCVDRYEQSHALSD